MAYTGTASTATRQVATRLSSSRQAFQGKARQAFKAHAAKQQLLPDGLFRDGLKTEVHQGTYGNWSVDDNDIAEVLAYRAGIILCAVCVAVVYAGAGVSDKTLLQPAALNTVCLLGTASLGTSLVLVHMYVTEIKRVIQAFFVAGALGEVWLMATQDQAAVSFVADHAWATLLVGPAFAAVTGLAIKEGLCYGKYEAAGLAVVTPVWLLGHLSNRLPPAVDQVLAASFVAIFVYFASQKLTQNIKDDIGDKTIFTFRKLPESEQDEVIRRIQEGDGQM